MIPRELLSVAGFGATLMVLDDKKKREIISTFEEEARKLLATGFIVPLDLEIPIEISTRLHENKGVFSITNFGKTKVIRVSYELILGSLLDNNFEVALDTLRHEVVHYALFLLGYSFEDDTFAFESTIERLGISSNVYGPTFFPQYHIIDTYHYTCNCTGPRYFWHETYHTKKERALKCPFCDKQLYRAKTELYKYPPLPLDFVDTLFG